jgi:GMP synthase-like glutamine amidotransferase
MNLKVCAIQHSPIEPMGLIENVLRERKIEYEYLEVYETNEVDEKVLATASHIVILGGPMGAYEDDRYSFIAQEKEIIRRCFKSGLPVLGICLGAQLIANAVGSDVYPYKTELGWYDVKKVGNHELFDPLPSKMKVFQWHNDTFDLPEGAKLVYAGEEVKNQAFVIGNLVGIQFHIEVTPEIVEVWVNSEKSLSNEDRERILSQKDVYAELEKSCRELTNRFLNM